MKSRVMRREYIKFLPVCSRRTAEMLKKEALWDVLEAIRSSGFRGITARQIEKKTHEPISTIYNAISQLTREGYIIGMKPSKLKAVWGHRRKEPREPGKTPKKFFEACERRSGMDHREEGKKDNPYGDVIFYDDFFHNVGSLINKEPELKEIRKSLLDFTEKFYRERIMNSNGKVKKMIPDKETCPHCGRSHEGYEFFKAMLLYIVTNQVLDSSDFNDFLKKLGFKD